MREVTHDSRHRLAGLAASMLLAIATASVAGCERSPAIPDRLDDSTFWALSRDLSEPGGYFHSDNFVSNELGFQYVIEDIRSVGAGGVYLGVGPDQNFTYVAALKPRIAFIVDIRRPNMMQHLMYKALIEMSRDRAEFLGRLFSRRWPEPPEPGLPAEALFTLLSDLPRDTALFQSTLGAIYSHLAHVRAFPLDSEDRASIAFVFGAFFQAGPALTYSSNLSRGFGSRNMPSYRMLMTATDQDGVNRSYLGSDEAFGVLKDLQERNLIVPVVGDFGGPRALRAVGDWVRQHGAAVNVFYVSNVEQYLFQQGEAWQRFYESVSSMPLDRRALFVRSVSLRGWRLRQHPYARSSSVTSSIREVLAMYRSGWLQSYGDILEMAR
ncbi:MAG: hypothetical protein HUU26_06680 [Gemmatimonadaceae bacterium]|nr:hypothetical protein [Gemmatimonadaceae bacterium]